MSRFSKQLCKQLVTLARQGRGSYKTVADRSRIAERFSERLSDLNIQIRDVKHIKTSHVEKYMESRKTENLSLRTLQNEMSAIRSILLSAGRNKLADPNNISLSNHALGISGANRDGTKLPITDEKLNSVVNFAQRKDEGVALAVQLSRYLGLRTEETVQSAKSLKTWRQALINNHERVRIVFGTKGGRPRETTVYNREKVLSILDKAIQYISEHNGKLIDKPSLHTAIDRYRNIVREAGMNGKNAPHSLRYAYSRDAVNHHIKNGMSRDEAEALVSMDLGHGDGRGRYIKQVYFRKETE
ncbi:TPA: integrase domain-containing protein [Klebsiella variicola subsp. variicola]|uniref:integrase domain-containing protein n=1 Tax=Enterobacteriaceae TaxID=543 RepID=UPI0007CC92C8|nr:MULTISPECIES: integrase domain-containing protein [Enterobacteriaceae]EIV5419381.1 integrase domain-containing protein [Klebsiella aerogenes]HAN1837163.1 site-specific integrase [Escherichia coli]HAV1803897.1 site-specific integrase [Enterobacter hormaechei subsp. steigerwaltii]HBR1994551.1 integrase domain-containing protein [Klebsiella quasipneumoniae subsp. similipneumoniae]HBV7340415.1 integrase domain-containing protein [Klebsiella variicola]HDX8863530.1 integrase domain-containing pr